MKVWKAKTLFKSSNDKWPKIVERVFNELEREGWNIESFEFSDKDKHFMLVIYSREMSKDEYKNNTTQEKRIRDIEEYLIQEQEQEEENLPGPSPPIKLRRLPFSGRSSGRMRGIIKED